ncbi:MAG: hypothetical protein KGO96_07185 [Elusimicrobia bacterium]|nr:hypothetical protein [Elusimicrobiota bacterium]
MWPFNKKVKQSRHEKFLDFWSKGGAHSVMMRGYYFIIDSLIIKCPDTEEARNSFERWMYRNKDTLNNNRFCSENGQKIEWTIEVVNIKPFDTRTGTSHEFQVSAKSVNQTTIHLKGSEYRSHWSPLLQVSHTIDNNGKFYCPHEQQRMIDKKFEEEQKEIAKENIANLAKLKKKK